MIASKALGRLGITEGGQAGRFPDGAHFRIEIPSVEGPGVLETVIREAETRGVVINRVSQGSGAMLLTNSELYDMACLGAEAGLEVALFAGPREGYDVGCHVRSPDGAGSFGQVRGIRQLAYAAEDVARATEAGIRSFLVADQGLLMLLVEMQRGGEIPADCRWKVSVSMPVSNPASLMLLERLGASTVNIPSDVTVVQIREMRSAVQLPIDLYLESPDSLGGVVRSQELRELVLAGAPIYTKFGLRNSEALYPAGEHNLHEACLIAKEKVHRAAVALEWTSRLGEDLIQSKPGATGLAIPAPNTARVAPVTSAGDGSSGDPVEKL